MRNLAADYAAAPSRESGLVLWRIRSWGAALANFGYPPDPAVALALRLPVGRAPYAEVGLLPET